ncbi:hypothetical protein CHCC20335_1898 [Bacillus paralicheniformis]|nr:hypothetical protein CHCC20335_1898 [Bacillus paralicheniformis]
MYEKQRQNMNRKKTGLLTAHAKRPPAMPAAPSAFTLCS